MAQPTPRTPTRTRLAPPRTPSQSQSTASSPILRRAPVGVSASPQVRSAIALLRKKHQSTPAVEGSTPRSTAVESEVQWLGFRELDVVVDKAKETGRLNISSRELSKIPALVFEELASSTSKPSDELDLSSSRLAFDFDLSIPDHDPGRRWYDARVELVCVNASNNELSSLPDSIGGLEYLQILDLHNNRLHSASIPSSIGSLTSLTTLNLAGNNLKSFPLQLLALSSLRDLSLAGTGLRSLWPANAVPPPAKAPLSKTPNGNGIEETSRRRGPFPSLSKLSLANNPIIRGAFDDGFELPPRLVTLDLSECGITQESLPAHVFGVLANLVLLDLSGNSLSDPVFAGVVRPEFFPSLQSLDLTNNRIDSLETLEAVAPRRPHRWLGLPKAMAHLLPSLAGGVEGLTIEIQLPNNPLRGRRRPTPPPPAVNIPSPSTADPPSPPSDPPLISTLPPSTPLTSPILVPALEELHIADSPTLLADEPPPSFPAAADVTPDTPEASPNDPSVVLVFSAYSSKTNRLNLGNRGLSTFPLPQSGAAPPSLAAAHIDLQHNILASLPLSSLETWHWGATLRSLNLSHNRAAVVVLEGCRGAFEVLAELDVSHNTFTSKSVGPDGEERFLFSVIAGFAPNLTTLDLSDCRLSSLEGIGEVLVPGRGRGIALLKLGGNRIEDVEDLVQVATAFQAGTKAESWRCSELDLRYNAISRLPPVFGHLPLRNLLVEGNTFRIPRREICLDGGLLEWLRDRS